MPLPKFISNIFSGGVKDVIGTIGGIVDDLTLSKEEKETLKIKLIESTNSHIEKMATLAQAETEAYFKDMDSARQMQIEALKNTDTFSKRFVYYLTIFILVITGIYDFCFFFISYPERNHDTITMIAGVLNSVGFASIISFFFGSSKSSEKKQDQINDILSGNKT